MHEIHFAQWGHAGMVHRADVPNEWYDEWMGYARKRGHIIIVDKLTGA